MSSLPIRKSLRLRHYDYATPGMYFITTCVHGRRCLFGQICDGRMQRSALGDMVARYWQELPEQFPSVALGDWVVMPNHFHGVVELGVQQPASGEPGRLHLQNSLTKAPGALQLQKSVTKAPGALQLQKSASTAPLRLQDVMQWWKSITSSAYRLSASTSGPDRDCRLWQRGFHDRVIRNSGEHALILQYIHNNPLQWHLDKLHP